ncbi:MAG: hypothetical protein JNM41_07960, partial [Flavipsychrobacter sp.]|nr:hypothetical protein [Flavipsychrobacter sp.]
TNPVSTEGITNIGFGTAGNYFGGRLGGFLGVPIIKIGKVSAPNVFGPSLNIGSNAAGNAASDAATNYVYPPENK